MSLHPFGVVHWVPDQSCRTSRQRLGVNRIDSCNFELCLPGQLCITINSTVFKDGLGIYVKKDAGLSSSECPKKSFETHSSVAVLYRNEVSVHSFIHSFIFIHELVSNLQTPTAHLLDKCTCDNKGAVIESLNKRSLSDRKLMICGTN